MLGRVIVVGNACSILGQGLGNIIDNYDIVVRCNHGLPTEENKKDIGTRTDFVFFAGGWTKRNPITQEELRNRYGDDVIAISLDPLSVNNKKVIAYDYDKFHELCEMVYGQRKGHPHPSTGLSAIWHFVGKGYKVDIAGFDFFKTNDWTGEVDVINQKSASHNFIQEELFVEKLIKDRRVKLVKKKDFVIIGHSPTLFKKRRNIDKYDVVVRLNLGYPRPEKKSFMGTRTDIWFSWDGNDELYRSLEDKFNAKTHITWRDYPYSLFSELKREQRQDKAPTMGMLAYWYILKKLDPKTISLYGFDFFKTGDFFCPEDIIKNQEDDYHNHYKEEEWFWRTKPDFVKFYDEKNEEVIMNSKTVKKITNKAIQEPKEYKCVCKPQTIKCKSCGTEINYKGYPTGCPMCNTVNG